MTDQTASLKTEAETTGSQLPQVQPVEIGSTFQDQTLLCNPELYSSGIKFSIAIPCQIDSSYPLAVVRLSPHSYFGSCMGTMQPHTGTILENESVQPSITFFPVQHQMFLLRDSTENIITRDPTLSVHDAQLSIHEECSGVLNVTARVSSDTGVSGSLTFVQADDVVRNPHVFQHHDTGIRYYGYSTNQDLSRKHRITKDFIAQEMSLTRHVQQTSSWTATYPRIPHKLIEREYWKIWNEIVSGNESPTNPDYSQAEILSELYPESVLLIYLQTDLLGPPGQVTIDFFFDLTKIEYHTPVVPGYVWDNLPGGPEDITQWFIRYPDDYPTYPKQTILQRWRAAITAKKSMDNESQRTEKT